MAENKILIVDDEKDILEFLGYNLRKEGYKVYQASDGMGAIETARRITPDLIVLDVMMPRMDGIETCEKIREIPGLEQSMIVFLTARSEDYSQIAGFAAGGDDYIAKPIRPRVFLSRVKALLRRAQYGQGENVRQQADHVIDTGKLLIDREKYVVYFEGKEFFLPKKEFDLLVLLASSPSRVFTRDEIFNRVWGDDVFVGDRTIDVYVRKLREKFGQHSIRTIKGVGYCYEV
ncbi:MAG: response regulator transcription factor [Bacteroidales bacterium]